MKRSRIRLKSYTKKKQEYEPVIEDMMDQPNDETIEEEREDIVQSQENTTEKAEKGSEKDQSVMKILESITKTKMEESKHIPI